MEAPAPTTTNRNEASASVNGAQPQREKRAPRKGAANGQKAYYKSDLVEGEPTPQTEQVNQEPSDQNTREKIQHRPNTNAHKQQPNRSEKMYQPKERSATGSPSPETNGENKEIARPKRNPKPKQGNQRVPDGGNKKNYQKKKETPRESEEQGNERFNNASVVDRQDVSSRDPHKAQQVAEASRLQQIVPSGISPEIEEKVKRIQEVVGKSIEFHVIYGVLEDVNYDEDRTISHFLEGSKGKSGKRDSGKQTTSNVPTSQPWTNIVKKGISKSWAEESINEDEAINSRPHHNGGHQSAQRSFHPAAHQPVVATPAPAPSDPEELVTNLSSAIASQLKMIQEQTKLLTTMQSELANITQTGLNERESLLSERTLLEQRAESLHSELAQVEARVGEIEILLEENQKKKAEKLTNITNNSLLVASLLQNKSMQHYNVTSEQQAPKPNHQRPHQQDGRPHQQDGRPHQQDGRPHQQDGRPHQDGRPQVNSGRSPHQRRNNYQEKNGRN